MNSTIGAIFLPCRGGGTATTYYTDIHDVDEDIRTISNYGGLWHYERNAGVMSREVSFIESTHDKTDVASRLIYLS